MMKSAFICWSPFQLLNMLNFCMNGLDKNKKTLFLIDPDRVTCNLEEVKKLAIFEEIYVLWSYEQKYHNRGIRKIKKGLDMLFPRRSIKRYGLKITLLDMQYDYIYLTGWHFFAVNLLKLNPKSHIIMLDDGTGSYLGKVDFNKNLLPSLYRKVTGNGPQYNRVESLYLNAKDLYISDAWCDIRQLPPFNEQIKNEIENVFMSCCPKVSLGGKRTVIYLFQEASSFCVPLIQDESILNQAIETCGINVAIRKHPLYRGEVPIKNAIDISGGMWEIICNGCVNDDSILISIFSTAQFTPYILYKMKPTLILFYKIVLKKSSDLYKQIDQFVSLYRSVTKSRVYIPETIEDFESIIKNV